MEQTQMEQMQTTNNQNNHKKLLILVAILIIVIVAVGGFFLFKDSIFAPEKEEPKQEHLTENEKSEPEINDEKRKTDLNEIKIALELCYDNDGKYPVSNELTKLNENSPAREELLKYANETLLEDPKSPEFYYGYKSDGSFYELSAKLENLEDEECELLNSNLCIYKIVEGNNANSKESPTDAYMNYYDALMGGNMEEMKKHLAKSMVEQIEQSGMGDAEILEMVKWLVPEEIEITDEKIENDSAILTATGGFDFQEGTIEMVKENEEWKLLKESWAQSTSQQLPKEETDIIAVDIVFNQTEEDKADLKAIIKNNGKATISQASYSFSINEATEKGGCPVYNFEPGKELEFDLSHAYSNYYNHHYKNKSDKDAQKPFKLEMVLILDPKNELEEFDEENNKITKTFYMQEM